jgi:hypothetical protein
MSRIGAIAAAPFLGGQFVSLYLGGERVPTVPGKPVILSVIGDEVEVTVANNGDGSEEGAFNLYVNGTLTVTQTDAPWPTVVVVAPDPLVPGDTVRVSSSNSIGEGPLSDPVTVTS